MKKVKQWIHDTICGKPAVGQPAAGPCRTRMTLPDKRMPRNKWYQEYQISRSYTSLPGQRMW